MSDLLGLFQYAPDAETRPAGTVIFTAGEPGTVMYVVRRGEVTISVGDETVETVGVGGLIGEMALLDDEPRSATARAATACELVPVDRKRFLFLVQQTPFFALQVMRTMATRLRGMNARVA